MRSSFFVLIAKLLRYGFVFICQIILMNLLDPADFGLMRFVALVLGIVNLLNEAGLGVAVVQKRTLHPNETASSFSLVFIFSFALYALIFFSAPLIAAFFANNQLIPLIRLGGLSAPLGGVSIVHRSLMQRGFQYGRLSLIEASSALIGSGVGIVLGYCGFGVWSLIWSVLIYNALSSTLSIIFGERLSGKFTAFRSSIPLWIFGAGAVVQRIVDYASSNFDSIVIGKLFGAHDLGIYSVAFSTISLPQFALGSVLMGVAISIFSRVQEDDERLRAAFLRLSKITAILSIPYFLLFFTLAPEFMKVISFVKHGDKWVPAAQYIKLLAPMGMVYCLAGYPSLVWIAKGKIRLRVIWAAISGLSMVATVAVGSIYGMSGICTALIIRALLFFPVLLFVNNKTFQLAPLTYLQAIAAPLACGMTAALALWGMRTLGWEVIERHLFIKIVVYGALCLGVYGLMLKITMQATLKDLFGTFVAAIAPHRPTAV